MMRHFQKTSDEKDLHEIKIDPNGEVKIN